MKTTNKMKKKNKINTNKGADTNLSKITIQHPSNLFINQNHLLNQHLKRDLIYNRIQILLLLQILTLSIHMDILLLLNLVGKPLLLNKIIEFKEMKENIILKHSI